MVMSSDLQQETGFDIFYNLERERAVIQGEARCLEIEVRMKPFR